MDEVVSRTSTFVATGPIAIYGTGTAKPTKASISVKLNLQLKLKLRKMIAGGRKPGTVDEGRIVLYQSVLAKIELERPLYLAICQRVYTDVFEERIGRTCWNEVLSS